MTPARTSRPTPTFKPPFSGAQNEVFKVGKQKGWYVSYNADPAGNPFSSLCETMMVLVNGEGTRGAETALKLDGRFYILDGDHRRQVREAYAEAGKYGVLQYFLEHLVHHPWSSGEKQDLEKCIASSRKK